MSSLSPLHELYLFFILVVVCFLPGSTLLIVSGTWRRWQGLQRYSVAIGLSLAFYPVLFYTVRFLLPTISLGPYLLGTLLLLATLVTGWGWTKRQAFSLKPGPPEWAALAVLGLTLLSRLWFAHAYPFPAWSDSLHHTLLTSLTAQNGRLPTTLEPYFPNTLEMYHLGLYALSGTVEMLARVPSHTALLWTAQFLNGLSGVGIYLVLDRYVGRTGAVVGLAVAGIFSIHPALWANWGRFTQLSSQILLPIAWALTIETLVSVDEKAGTVTQRTGQRWLLFCTGLTTAAVFLYHFRVAIFYFLLLLPTVVIWLWRAPSARRWPIVKALTAAGAIALLLILPVLWDAGAVYLSQRAAVQPELTSAEREEMLRNYYVFPLSTVPHLAAPIWLLLLSGVAALVGLVRRNLLTLTTLLWVLLLLLLGNAYLLQVPVLNITNLGAILIMFYLPISLVVGAAAEELVQFLPRQYQAKTAAVLLALLLLAALPAAYARATTVEPYRHFVTAADVEAMEWIAANVPDDAVFAINTYPWLPKFAHGTDAGYWIPYLTGRQIVTSSMLSDGLPPGYWQRTWARSEAAEALTGDLDALATLYDLGVHYIYVGKNGDFSGPGLSPETLNKSERVEQLYQKNGTAIFRIRPLP